MRKQFVCFFALILALTVSTGALEKQSASDYHARREALAKKAGGLVVLLAPLEPMDSVYEFRQENNFYYLSGSTVPGAALLIAPAVEAQGDTPARAYTEILFLPPRNTRAEKFTGPQLGADSPDAAKVTGFDRVAEMNKLPEEVAKVLSSGGRPLIYTEDRKSVV